MRQPGLPITGATRRWWLAGAGALQFTALCGILVVPSAGWLWAVVLGIAIGPLFPLTMTLPLDAAERPAEVAALAGMMLGVGYTLSALSPFLLGTLRDLTGSFTAVVWALAAGSAALVVVDATVQSARGSQPLDRSGDTLLERRPVDPAERVVERRAVELVGERQQVRLDDRAPTSRSPLRSQRRPRRW